MSKKSSHSTPSGAVDAAAPAAGATVPPAPAMEVPAAAEPAARKIKPQEASVTFKGEEARLFDALRTRHGVDGTKLKKTVLLRAALAALAAADEERIAQLVAGVAETKAVGKQKQH